MLLADSLLGKAVLHQEDTLGPALTGTCFLNSPRQSFK